MKYILEAIEWYDFESDVSWCDKDDAIRFAKGDFLVTEVGFVYYEDKDKLMIVSQIANDGTVGNRTRVYKALIKSRRKLTYGRKRDNGAVSPNGQKASRTNGKGEKT